MQMTPHVLVVEDEDSLATLLQYNLQKEGYDVALVSRSLRRLQTGFVRNYALALFTGGTAVLFFVLLRGSL